MRSRIVVCMILSFAWPALAAERPAARVNGTSITEKEVTREIGRLIPQTTFHATINPERQLEFRDKAVENLVNRELQYQEAARQGLSVDKKIVKQELDATRNRFRSKKEYLQALENEEITEDELRLAIRKNMLAQKAVEKMVNEPARVSEVYLKEYYNGNLPKFKAPASVRVRIISSKDRKKVENALERIRSGEDYGSVAALVSEDNYRIKGGDIGYVHRGRLLPEIEAEAFSLKSGGVSQIISAESKWFIVKVEDKKEEYQKSFEEARESLKKELEQSRANEMMTKWMEELRAKAKIEIFSVSKEGEK